MSRSRVSAISPGAETKEKRNRARDVDEPAQPNSSDIDDTVRPANGSLSMLSRKCRRKGQEEPDESEGDDRDRGRGGIVRRDESLESSWGKGSNLVNVDGDASL
jgi:hypothetical protein